MDSKYKEFLDHQNGYEIDVSSNFSNYDDLYPYTENGYIPNIPSPDLNFMNLPFDPADPEPNHLDQSFTSNTINGPFDPENVVVDPSAGGGKSSDFSLGLSWSPEGEAASPVDSDSSSDPLLKFIGDMLLEEDIEDKPYMFDDLIALKATEKSLYEAIGQQYPPSGRSNVGLSNHDSLDNYSGSGSDYHWNTTSSNSNSNSPSPSTSTSTSTSNGISSNAASTNGHASGPKLAGDVGVDLSTLQAYFPNDDSGNNNLPLYLQPLENSSIDVFGSAGELSGTSASEMVQNMFNDSDSILLFKKGLEEASKFLPNPSRLVIDLDSCKFASETNTDNSESTEETIDNNGMVNGPKSRKAHGCEDSDLPKSRKAHGREDSDLDGVRSRKQSAIGVEDNVSERDGDLSDMFDKVLLFAGLACNEHASARHDWIPKAKPASGQDNGSKGGKSRAKRQERKKESVDLRTLLILCAQAMSTSDFRTASELLKQIRQHSSPCGDGSQRLAHYFANGLEARLAGSTTSAQSFFQSLSVKKTTAADMLKAFQTLVSACPFKKLAIFHANKMILRASKKATTLHIVDFGIIYGYHWPVLIELLSSRPGGPPKLRITGIELPQRGFKPAERIEETGRRLANYCKKFNVPFEYHPIAERNWENIRVEDLDLKSDEFIAVNSLCRLRNLLDETGEEGYCPRDAVLNLIRKMNPGIFCLAEINGSYNSPFFVTRFREALFHFSSFYDIFDCTLARDNPSRDTIEAEFYGREAINAIACEGPERVDRPETYKQWHARTLRAGFKPVPLDPELLSKFRDKLNSYYHSDFVIDRDGHWILQGWKGRILYASSCWVPA